MVVNFNLFNNILSWQLNNVEVEKLNVLGCIMTLLSSWRGWLFWNLFNVVLFKISCCIIVLFIFLFFCFLNYLVLIRVFIFIWMSFDVYVYLVSNETGLHLKKERLECQQPRLCCYCYCRNNCYLLRLILFKGFSWVNQVW